MISAGSSSSPSRSPKFSSSATGMPGVRRECSRSSARRSRRRVAASAVAFGAVPSSAARIWPADSCTNSQASGVAAGFATRPGLRADLRVACRRSNDAAGCERSRSSATLRASSRRRALRDRIAMRRSRSSGARSESAVSTPSSWARAASAASVPEAVPHNTIAKSPMPASASVRVTFAAASRWTSGP